MEYLNRDSLDVQIFGRGVAWLDSGTANSLQDASHFVQSIEARQSYKISCPEEISVRMGFITSKSYFSTVKKMPESEYREYLMNLHEEIKDSNIDKEKAISELQK